MSDGLAVMTASDFDEVEALWTAAGMWPHVGEDRAWVEAAAARNSGCALVWKERGRVVGVVVGAWDGLRGWIYHFTVEGACRKRGLGTKLLQAAEERLRDKGIRQINIMVYEKNEAAQEFYTRRGYEYSPVRVMRKRLCEE